jgi:hypothetical protein
VKEASSRRRRPTVLWILLAVPDAEHVATGGIRLLLEKHIHPLALPPEKETLAPGSNVVRATESAVELAKASVCTDAVLVVSVDERQCITLRLVCDVSAHVRLNPFLAVQ